MRLFTDWPRDWDAAFTLFARRGLIVSAARQGGAVPLVTVETAPNETVVLVPKGEAPRNVRFSR